MSVNEIYLAAGVIVLSLATVGYTLWQANRKIKRTVEKLGRLLERNKL